MAVKKIELNLIFIETNHENIPSCMTFNLYL
jgi:hypothetical protein